MEPRRIKDLAQRPDHELFSELSKGLSLCLANALRISRDVQTLRRRGRLQSAAALNALVREDAGKFHILMDAARCPRAQLGKHLAKFSDHVAKGIYSMYYSWMEPAHFYEVENFASRERESHYLDGPTGYEFLFRNSHEADREEAMYVDYCSSWEGPSIIHWWYDPGSPLARAMMNSRVSRPRAFDVAFSMHRAGMTKPMALRMISDIWQPLNMDGQVSRAQLEETNDQTLLALESAGLIPENWHRRRYRVDLVSRWLFPMCSLELAKRDVKKEKESERFDAS